MTCHKYNGMNYVTKNFSYFFWLATIVFFFGCTRSGIPQAEAQTGIGFEKSDTSEVRTINARRFYIYKVGKSETVYSISKKFGIPQEEIYEFNPDVEKAGLKNKMKIWIPAESWMQKKNAHLPEQVKELPRKNKYWNVLLITGIGLPKIYIGPADARDSTIIDEPLPADVQDNISFAEGAMKGAEDVAHAGQRVHLTIRDSENDSSRIDKIFHEMVAPFPDIVITNLEGNQLRAINRNCMDKGILLLSCAMNTTEVIRQNSAAASLFPSSLTQCREMGKFLGKQYSAAVAWIVNTGNAKENDRSTYYKEGLHDSAPEIQFKTADYTHLGVVSLTDSLVKGKKNLVFIPSSNEDLVSTILNAVKDTISYYDVMVVGLPTWHYFESLDPDLMQANHVVLFNSGSSAFNPEMNVPFRKYYREHYNSEPRDPSYTGFDAVFISSRVFTDPKTYLHEMDKPVKGLFSEYLFRKFNKGQCLENRIIHPLRYDNFNLIPLPDNH